MTPRLLTPETVELLQSSVAAIQLASRDAQLRPHMAFGYGCRVDVEQERLRAGISRRGGAALIGDVRASGLIALVACHIHSFFTIQVKGRDARLEEADAALRRHALSYHTEFVRKSAEIGFPPDAIAAHMHVDPEDLVVVTFTVAAAFVQTPGPGAGTSVAGAV